MLLQFWMYDGINIEKDLLFRIKQNYYWTVFTQSFTITAICKIIQIKYIKDYFNNAQLECLGLSRKWEFCKLKFHYIFLKLLNIEAKFLRVDNVLKLLSELIEIITRQFEALWISIKAKIYHNLCLSICKLQRKKF